MTTAYGEKVLNKTAMNFIKLKEVSVHLIWLILSNQKTYIFYLILMAGPQVRGKMCLH